MIFTGYEKKFSSFAAVLSDYIEIQCKDGSAAKIIYARSNLICVSTAGNGNINVTVEGKHKIDCIHGIEIHDTFDGEYTGIKQIGNTDYFAFAKDIDGLIGLIEYGETLDMDAEAEKKKALYKNCPIDENNPLAPLYTKCLPFEPYNFACRMQSIREYGWSNALLFDLLHNKYS